MKVHHLIYFIFIVLLTSACNSTKYVADGEYLLNKVQVHADIKEISKDELTEYLRQTPNSKMFGLFKFQLGIYNLSGKDTSKWLNRALKRLGDEPVIHNSTLTNISTQQLQLLYQNRGYMNAKVTNEIKRTGKKANVDYYVESKTPYRLSSYETNFSNKTLQEIASDTARSFVSKDMLFDVDILDAERDRVSWRIRSLGYYNFSKEFLIYEADSSSNAHSINLRMGLRDNLAIADDTISKAVFKEFTINKVYFHTNTDAHLVVGNNEPIVIDTVEFRDYVLIGPEKKNISLNALVLNTFITPNTLYSDLMVERTYSSLNALGPVKYVNITFKPTGNNTLDCHIIIVPAKTISFSTELEATYTESFWGGATNLNFTDRNIFGGAETFTLQTRYALENQINIMAQESSVQMGLKFPSFLMPFADYETRRRIRANTEFKTNFNYQFRPQEFTTINLGGGVKYLWNRSRYRHILDFVDLSYVYFPSFSESFVNNYINSGLYNRYNYEDHFIMRSAYTVSYSNFNANRPMRNHSNYRYSIETAGNILNGINALFNLPQDEDGSYRLFNIRYAQYVRTEYNRSYHQIFDKNNRFVYHMGVGVGVPYGNANIIPYERRFFSGGANSVRGWGESTLGPGTYQRHSLRRRDYNQVGDIKLDLNMEYRSKLIWVLESAVFLDAGNIWTIKDYDNQPGGVFRLNSFLSEMAIAYGFGLRWDFSFFILRTDLGMKLYDPSLKRTEQWRINPTRNDFAFHFAIGYPF